MRILRIFKFISTNSGVEAREAAYKFSRKLGYTVYGVLVKTTSIVFMSNNFWGRSITASSFGSDPFIS
jgi:acetylornithine/succinyldiaminopimelate/putrescine aminotransferase